MKLQRITICLVLFLFGVSSKVSGEISQAQLEILRSAKRVRIVIKESYSKAESVNLPFKEMTKSILSSMGLQIVGENSQIYDVTWSVNVKGQALGTTYALGDPMFPSSTDFHYTGAELSGAIVLNAPGIQKVERDFQSKVPIAQDILDKRLSPSDAPFFEAFKNNYSSNRSEDLWNYSGGEYTWEFITPMDTSTTEGTFPSVLLNLVKEIYGEKTLSVAFFASHWSYNYEKHILKIFRSLDVDARTEVLEGVMKRLSDENELIRMSAARLLGEIENPVAIEPLITALQENKNSNVREAFVKALGEFNNSRALEALKSAAQNDEDYYVRIEASYGVKEIEKLISAKVPVD